MVHIIHITAQTLKVIMMVVLLKLISNSMEDGKVAIQGKVMTAPLVGTVVVETIRPADRDPHMLVDPLLFAIGDKEELAVINLDAKTVMHKMVMQLKEAVEANRMEPAMELEMLLQQLQLANYIMPKKDMNLLNKAMNKMSMVMNWLLMNRNIREICST